MSAAAIRYCFAHCDLGNSDGRADHELARHRPECENAPHWADLRVTIRGSIASITWRSAQARRWVRRYVSAADWQYTRALPGEASRQALLVDVRTLSAILSGWARWLGEGDGPWVAPGRFR